MEKLINNSLKIKFLSIDDSQEVSEFCNDCKNLGFMNNQSLAHIKWEQTLRTGGYVAGLDLRTNKIFTIAGFHPLSEDSHSWRLLFRGAQLPGYTTNFISKNPLKTSIHLGHLLHYQLLRILDIDKDAKCYISTNVYSNTNAPKSYQLNSKMAPILEKQGIISLEKENVELFFTKQNLWRINIQTYFHQRSKIYLEE